MSSSFLFPGGFAAHVEDALPQMVTSSAACLSTVGLSLHAHFRQVKRKTTPACSLAVAHVASLIPLLQLGGLPLGHVCN